MIFVLDNYDSFTYNLVHLMGSLGAEMVVERNRETSVAAIMAMRPDGILLSPGPSRPENAGCMLDLIHAAAGRIPMLGVCLGHQAICAAYGAKVTYAKELMHGKQSVISFMNNSPIFKGIDEGAPVARYHSLAADAATIPDCFNVTAVADDGEIMAVQHKEFPIYGVQFHPESIMTPDGKIMLRNFIEL